LELLEKIRKARHVFIIGNGGSYANAQHVQNDLLSVGIQAFTLDPATLTAFANDFGYENVFSRWLETVGTEGDLLIALSGSGRSKNILNAIDTADRKGMDIWREFGSAKGLDMQASEEDQIRLGHDLMRALRDPSSR
jgi:D-sedoheptulose 7-phosphate isomerase